MPSNSATVFSVVIPVYNEEKAILETMRRVRAFLELKNISWECVISDDGSTDRTRELAQNQIHSGEYKNFSVVSAEKNQGKGAAARRGMLAAKGDFILLTDADLSSPMKESDKLVAALNDGFDIAIGSRALRSPGADVQQTFKRRISGRIFNILVQLILLRGIHDTQCGFKCFKAKAAKELFSAQKLAGFSFDVEILWRAQKHGYKIKEVPVMWRQGADSKVRLFRDSFRMVRDLIRLRTSSR